MSERLESPTYTHSYFYDSQITRIVTELAAAMTPTLPPAAPEFASLSPSFFSNTENTSVVTWAWGRGGRLVTDRAAGIKKNVTFKWQVMIYRTF